MLHVGSIHLERKREREKPKKKKKKRKKEINEGRFYCMKEGFTGGRLRRKSIITYLHTYLHKYISAGLYKKEEWCHNTIQWVGN